MEIRAATQQGEMDAIRRLWREYEAFLQVDLCFQGFEEELAGLPGRYAPPKGGLFVAVVDGVIAGTAAFYAQGEGVAEIKRLYVTPAYQGLKIGRLLLAHAMDQAEKAGYKMLRMDSMRRLEAAGKLYQQVGFYEIQPFNHSPHDDAYYMEYRFGERVR